MTPAISICIPAYKRIEYLQRLLESISLQTFRDFEVVVTDDSPDTAVEELCRKFADRLPIVYHRNSPALGTPENWNEGIRKARGRWIKIMHDDDWFSSANSLQRFMDATRLHPQCAFFFSAFENIDEDNGKHDKVRCGFFERMLLRWSPLVLFRKVHIGNPSCTLVRSDVELLYDSRFKYVVDFEYYIRCIDKLGDWHYIDEVLLNIGFNQLQVTKYTFLVKEVQIPENHLLLQKMGASVLRNPLVFDYYWRMYRNLRIRTEAELQALTDIPLHPICILMVRFQRNIPAALLNTGVTSKLFMGICYLVSLFTPVNE